MYESPISIYEQISNDYVKQKDEYIYQAIVKVGVDVNKEELIKALAYDREQYSKGFADGFEQGVKEFAERLKENSVKITIGRNGKIEPKEYRITTEELDNLLNELVGEADE